MRFLRRTEWVFNPEMHLKLAATKPNASTRDPIYRLWNLNQPKHSCIEIAGGLLFTSWHCELHVVYTKNSRH